MAAVDSSWVVVPENEPWDVTGDGAPPPVWTPSQLYHDYINAPVDPSWVKVEEEPAAKGAGKLPEIHLDTGFSRQSIQRLGLGFMMDDPMGLPAMLAPPPAPRAEAEMKKNAKLGGKKQLSAAEKGRLMRRINKKQEKRKKLCARK